MQMQRQYLEHDSVNSFSCLNNLSSRVAMARKSEIQPPLRPAHATASPVISQIQDGRLVCQCWLTPPKNAQRLECRPLIRSILISRVNFWMSITVDNKAYLVQTSEHSRWYTGRAICTGAEKPDGAGVKEYSRIEPLEVINNWSAYIPPRCTTHLNRTVLIIVLWSESCLGIL
jgi:hypothetical protein